MPAEAYATATAPRPASSRPAATSANANPAGGAASPAASLTGVPNAHKSTGPSAQQADDLSGSSPRATQNAAAKRPAQPSSVELARRWRVGDQQAATALFNRYFDKVSAIVERRVNRRFNARMAGEEIVQSAFGSMFRVARDKPKDFRSDEMFRRWLITIVLRKAYTRINRESAKKRDPRREQAAQSSESFAAYVSEQLCQGPDQESALEVSELLELVETHVTPGQARLMRLRQAGLSQKEIAAELNVNVRTIRRWSDKLDERAREVLRDALEG